MLNLESMIRAAFKEAGEQPIVVSAPYELSQRLQGKLNFEGILSGYIAESAASAQEHQTLVAGWWIDRTQGCWYLRRSRARTIALLSGHHDTQVSGRMLLEARISGITTILIVNTSSVVCARIDVTDELLKRLEGPVSLEAQRLSFRGLFQELFEAAGNKFSLPKSDFHQDRVLLFSGSLAPGGSERQTAYTAMGLAQRKTLEVFIGCESLAPPRDFFKDIVEQAGVQIVTTTDINLHDPPPELIEWYERLRLYDALGVQHIVYTIYRFVALLRETRPALVHTWMDYNNVLAGIAAHLVGVPHLVLSGRSVAPDNFEIFQPYMKPGYLALAEREPFSLINNSAAGASDYGRWLGLSREQFSVIPNGFEFPPAMAKEAGIEVRRGLGFDDEAFVVGTISRLSEEKQPRLFVDMALAIHKKYPQTRFVIFGGGVMENELREYVTSQEASDVIKLPGVTKDAWSSLAAMDVFALTSRIEGLPNVLIEAQTMGIPVVCSGAGGMSETFIDGETGFSVRSSTPEGFADAIERFILDPALYQRMSDNASDHVRNTFGLEKMIDRTLAVYKNRRDLNKELKSH